MVLGRKDGRGVNNVDEAVIKRVPPHNDEAERSVIGAMLMDKDAIMTAAEMLTGMISIRRLTAFYSMRW